jgi:uncharacterized circularly permuted ATP-grasp superfamily protein/uncharacterized alpha-E superfamily protein
MLDEDQISDSKEPPLEDAGQTESHYPLPADRYDEMFEAVGKPRAHWQAIHELLDKTPNKAINARLTSARRQIRDSGITYNVYNDPEGQDRQWELDVLPLVISTGEWQHLQAGISQRARLFNRILADLYGPQRLLTEGLVPASLILGHSGFLRNAHGMQPPGNIFLHLYAADLARSPDGQWWVIADRTQAPSGAAYALENRLITSQTFPELFRSLGVRHLAQYFATMRDALIYNAPKGDGKPLAVVLTPGPFNETFFEHALLARYLGFRLVEGNDLTVFNNKVWLKTIEGPRRVHAIIRRQDDTYCDPLELRVNSTLGVAGLMQCVRSGTVLIANPPGSGILEAGALMGYMPKLCEFLLKEELLLPSIATWWCGEPAAMENAFLQHRSLVFKPADPGFPFEPIFTKYLSQNRWQHLEKQIRQHPERYVAQELVQMSQAPVLTSRSKDKLQARGIGLRLHSSIASSGNYVVMPGGLTRVASSNSSRVVSMQRGGSSKDTWVLSDNPLGNQFTLLRNTFSPDDLVPTNSAVTSRVAENEFWFGRTCERCESIARLLRVALQAELYEYEDGRHAPLHAMIISWGLADRKTGNMEQEMLHASTMENHPLGLAVNIRHLHQIAFQLRDRMSGDHWRTVNQLLYHAAFNKISSIDETLAWLDAVVMNMTTLSGFALDSMTRDTGFRFLSIGRRIERLGFMTRLFNIACNEGRDSGLTWLLELCDSVITYRSRYMSQPHWLPVLDLLVRDTSNPRALMFQVKGILDYMHHLSPHDHGACADLENARILVQALDIHTDFQPDSEKLLEAINALHNATYSLSDELTTRFFTLPGGIQGNWSSPWH